jgi:CheY-like chemotaxis protein
MEALRLITEFPFEAIMTDLGMPRMSGIQLISYVKASERNKETPVFVISGQDLSSSVLKDLGVVRVLSKPFSLGELAKSLNEFTEKKLKSRRAIAYAPELIGIFKDSCVKVLEHYCGARLEQRSPYIKSNNDRLHRHYGMISLFGRRLYGSVAFGCEPSFLEHILGLVFVGQKIHSQGIEALAQETFLEILNQMVGAFKIGVAPKLVPFQIGLPEYVHPDYKVFKHKVSGHVFCLPLAMQSHTLQLELCLGNLGIEPAIESTDFNLFLTA